MTTIPLRPVPDADWQRAFDACMADEYVAKKYDRERGLAENADFIRRYCPEVFRAGDREGMIVDIGPGFGHFMELCREAGWEVMGIDSALGEGGMGDVYVELAALLWQRQALGVLQYGWQDFVDWISQPNPTADMLWIANWCSKVRLFVSRGSWEQCYAEHLDGEPHHVHHKASEQRWAFSDELFAKWATAFGLMHRNLLPGGAVLIHGNGTDGAANERRYDQEMRRIAEEAGLTLVLHQGTRLWKWRKA